MSLNYQIPDSTSSSLIIKIFFVIVVVLFCFAIDYKKPRLEFPFADRKDPVHNMTLCDS